MDYLYGNLNKLVELQKYKFVSSDDSILTSIDNENYVDLIVNTQRLVTLKQIRKDLDPSDDLIKYYGLFAYNPETNLFDIQLGDEIAIGGTPPSTGGDNSGGGGGNLSDIKEAWVKIGESQKYEEITDPSSGETRFEPVYDDNGNPVMVPIYHKIDIGISETGQLILDKIPASALTDQTINGSDGSITYIQSVIDCNAGGEIY